MSRYNNKNKNNGYYRNYNRNYNNYYDRNNYNNYYGNYESYYSGEYDYDEYYSEEYYSSDDDYTDYEDYDEEEGEDSEYFYDDFNDYMVVSYSGPHYYHNYSNYGKGYQKQRHYNYNNNYKNGTYNQNYYTNNNNNQHHKYKKKVKNPYAKKDVAKGANRAVARAPITKQTSKPLAVVKKELAESLAKRIEPSNKGYQMLQMMGYEAGSGLGKSGAGILEPLPFEFKKDRKGLGVSVVRKETPALTAIAKIKKEKIFIKEVIEAEVKPPTTIEAPRKAPVEKMEVDGEDEPELLAPILPPTVITAPSPATKKRIHSPIRAPPPSPPMLQFKVEKVLQAHFGLKTGNVVTAEKSPTTLARPLTPEKLQSSLLPQAGATTKHPKFTLADADSAQQLRQIAECFSDDIELLRLRMHAEASLHVASDGDLVVAKILLNNAPDAIIPEHTFEFIRNEIVGWIGKYQYEDLDTPIFHSMSNNRSDITIVCENTYAYGCLEQCVAECAKMRTLARISIVRLPVVSQLLYSFGAAYAGIIRDPELFLAQVRAHVRGAALKSDRWIVVAHEVFPLRRRTEFLFLLDEPSALALTYHHNNKLFVCMQQVEFTNRGVLHPPDSV